MVAEQSLSPEIFPATPPGDWLTVRQAATHYQMSVDTLQHWLRDGRVPGMMGPVPPGSRGGGLCWYVCPQGVRGQLEARRPYRNVAYRTPSLLTPELIPVHAKRAQLLARIVADAFEMPLAQMLSTDRLPTVMEGKRVLLILLREMPDLYQEHGFPSKHGWALEELGRMVGRDHSTVLSHLRRIATRPTIEETAMLTECRAMVRRALIAQVQRRKERKAAPVSA